MTKINTFAEWIVAIAATGRIALQAEGSQVEFGKLELKPFQKLSDRLP